MRNDFILLVLSYNHPTNVLSLETLKKTNYDGNWALVVGEDDPQLENYKKLYPEEHLAIFNKNDYKKDVDLCDQGGSDKIGLYARLACFDIAKSRGFKYFLEFDDDYIEYRYRVEYEGKLNYCWTTHITECFEAAVEFLENNKLVQSVAFAQGGDFICDLNAIEHPMEKCMNSWFCAVDRPIKFNGRMNDDVNAYVNGRCNGQLFLTCPYVCIKQKPTQSAGTGMSDIYKDNGTYKKTLYTIIQHPTGVKVQMLGMTYYRLHHNVKKEFLYPCLISSQYKKTP